MSRIQNSLILTLLLVLAVSFAGEGAEPGVSRELASGRKAKIEGVTYDVFLSMDSDSNEKPRGRVDIAFDYQADNAPLLLDFGGEELGKMAVNGIEVENRLWENNHIEIDPKFLFSGRNRVRIEFVSADRALNRNPGYMYTLFVPNRAHSVFPCFDQPDIKATYQLTLEVPLSWTAVSNSPVVSSEIDGRFRRIGFGRTEPLSTYLFAFAAGEFEYTEDTRDGRTIGAYYRETDPERLGQLGEIFRQVHNSLNRLEGYTGIPYPFAKYDLVILPGFQFGGMEHTGATFYNDRTIFLGKSATDTDRLKRAQVIAHETAHMWFGDYVTMEWFDDVWTKEVFANYFAAMLTRALLPEYDHDSEWLRVYMTGALDQDRTDGTTPIRQELDNLMNAGLIYNNVIYMKSPLMMAKLEEIVGDENFRKGIRKYLADHAYGNATWDDVVQSMALYTDKDVERFSRVWVYEPGMPEISLKVEGSSLIVTQSDPRGRGIVWPQTFDVLLAEGTLRRRVTVSFDGSSERVEVPLREPFENPLIVPSVDGRTYGLLTLDPESLKRLREDTTDPEGIVSELRPVGRMAVLMILNENYLAGAIGTEEWLAFLLKMIENSSDPQTVSALTAYLSSALLDLPAKDVDRYEEEAFEIADSHSSPQVRSLILKSLIPVFRSPSSVLKFFKMWECGKSDTLGEDEITELALQLAVRIPERSEWIIESQRTRIPEGDRLRRFDYVSRAATYDPEKQDELFKSLSNPENRQIEPWTLSLLSLLNHPVRHERSSDYIIPALEMLPDIQSTDDIFFPANWASALLGSYRSEKAAELVERFLTENSEMNPLLLNKVRYAASRLMAKRRAD